MIVNKYQSGGGSGSGYTLPIASAQVLGGVKIGYGITVDSGGTISVEGGQGGDYMVVSELPASADTGQLFYVPEHNITTTYSGTAIDCSAVSEGYCAMLKRVSDDGDVAAIYRSGTNFHWGWKNDGQYHIKDGLEVPVRYQADTGNGIFNIWILGEGCYIALYEDVSSSQTSDYAYTMAIPAATYRYLGGQFVLVPDTPRLFEVNDSTTQVEWAAIYNALMAMPTEQRYNSTILWTGLRVPYGDYYYAANVRFHLKEIANSTMWFYGYSETSQNSTAVPYAYAFELTGDGSTLNFKPYPLAIGLHFTIDEATHFLDIATNTSNLYNWYQLYYSFNTKTPVAATALFKGLSIPVIVSQREVIANFKIGSKNYSGEWSINAGGSTLLYWKESPVYQVVSALTDVGVSTVTFEGNKLTLPQSFITSLTGETDLLIYGGYPEDASDIPIKLTSDGTNVNMYWGEQYNTGGTYTFVASGACANGTTIVYNNQGDFTCAISTSGSDYVFTLSGPWGDVASNPFYIPEIISYIEGQLVYTKDTHKLQVYNGTSWDVLN